MKIGINIYTYIYILFIDDLLPVQIFKPNIHAVGLALETTPVKEEDVLSPQISVTKDSELGGGGYKLSLNGMKVLCLDLMSKLKKRAEMDSILVLSKRNTLENSIRFTELSSTHLDSVHEVVREIFQFLVAVLEDVKKSGTDARLSLGKEFFCFWPVDGILP